MIYEGSHPVASQNHLLGQFKLVRVPPMPIGNPKVKVMPLLLRRLDCRSSVDLLIVITEISLLSERDTSGPQIIGI